MGRKPLIYLPAKYGVAASILNTLLILFFYHFGSHPLLIPPFLDSRILLFLIFIYFAIREFKERYNGGYLHLWEGMIIGVLLYSIVGLFGAAFIQLYTLYEPEFLTGYIAGALTGMEAAKEELLNGEQAVKMTPEEFESHVIALKNTTAVKLAVDYLIKTLIIGFFIPLLYSVIFRKVER